MVLEGAGTARSVRVEPGVTSRTAAIARARQLDLI